MTLPLHEKINAHRFKDGVLHEETMDVAAEYPVLLLVNGNALATIAASADNLEYLALGHLVSEGIISSHEEVVSVSFNEEELSVHVSLNQVKDVYAEKLPRIVTGGGRARKLDAPDEYIHTALPAIGAETVTSSMTEFLGASELRTLTRGFHAAALYSLKGEKLAFFDEIGRHSAIDKVIGFACSNGIPLNDKMILSTGRISSEIAGKIVYSGVPVFISRASPTFYAVELLRKYNVLSICRATENGFTIIHGHDSIRIKTSS